MPQSRLAWLPPGFIGAVCLSVDDVHPTAADARHGPGEVGLEALRHLGGLLARHRQLHATLFTTPDWRSRGVPSSRSLPHRIPVIRDLTYAVRPLPRGTLRLDRHPAFVASIRALPRTDVGLHGLYHVRRGPRGVEEFAGRTRVQCRRMLRDGHRILADAGLAPVPGVTPPGWHAPPALLQAMADLDMRFISSGRDLETAVTPNARACGSGLRGVPLIHPHVLPYGRLVHVTTNFQATSSIERAMSILQHGGLLAIKAHLLTRLGSYQALDGLDARYAETLDRLFSAINARFGAAIWWTTMAELAARVSTPR